MQCKKGTFLKLGSGRELIFAALFTCCVAAASGCSRIGKMPLNSAARIEQYSKRQAVKDAQIETIKQELEKQPELTDSEKASALQAVQNAPIADTNEEQAANLLQALSDFLASKPSLENLAKRQKALLGVSMAFSAKVAKEALLAGSSPEEATAMQQTLMDQAFGVLLKNGMSSAEILLLAAKELSALPDANVALVEKLLDLPSLEGISGLQRMLALEEGVATLRECVDPSAVREGQEYFCPNGSKRVGTAVFSSEYPSFPLCTSDGQVNCAVPASGTLKVADTTGLGAKVISTASVAGVTGTVVLPTTAQVQTGVAFGATGALTGSLVAKLADCTADGETNCSVPAAGNLKVADTAGLSTKVVLGYTVAGEAGSVRLPTADQVVASVAYGAFDGVTGTVVLPTTAQVQTGVIFGAASALTGTLLGRLADCAADGDANCTVPAAGALKAADTTGLGAKVISTASVAGVTGTVVLPHTAQVQTGVTFGAAGALTGSLVAKLADCAADGETNCTVPAAGALKVADTANFNGWDIRKKRNATGAVLTFAGLAGQSKTCRNRARLGLYNNTTAPADASGLVPDFFDTIDDNNNGVVLGIPLDYPDWTIAGVSGSHGEDFACGGIYATGSVSTGFTGADGTLAHDPDGNWQDLTPGIVPGGANSTNTSNGCNSSDKHCVFKELISGLMVTEVSATPYTWQDAINYCHNLGEAGGVITSPIPVIGGASFSDWRLPTQKELTHLSSAGIRGLNQTSNLTGNFGNVDNIFWSASSVSVMSASAWSVGLYDGNVSGANYANYATYATKSSALRVACVR